MAYMWLDLTDQRYPLFKTTKRLRLASKKSFRKRHIKIPPVGFDEWTPSFYFKQAVKFITVIAVSIQFYEFLGQKNLSSFSLDLLLH